MFDSLRNFIHALLYAQDGKFGNLGECYDAGSGTYMSMGCNEASGAVTANMYVSEGCPKNSFLQTIDGIFNGEPCSPWECTVIGRYGDP